MPKSRVHTILARNTIQRERHDLVFFFFGLMAHYFCELQCNSTAEEMLLTYYHAVDTFLPKFPHSADRGWQVFRPLTINSPDISNSPIT